MKSITICAAILATTLLVTGCKNTGTQTIENKAFAVTWVVSKKVLKKHPEYREGFTIAREQLATLAVAVTVGLPEIMEIIDRLPVEELQDDDTALYVEAGILFFADDVGKVAIENPEQVRFAARGMVRAIDRILRN